MKDPSEKPAVNRPLDGKTDIAAVSKPTAEVRPSLRPAGRLAERHLARDVLSLAPNKAFDCCETPSSGASSGQNALLISLLVKFADEQAEVNSVYQTVAIKVHARIVAAAGNAGAGIESADKDAEVRRIYAVIVVRVAR